MPQQGRRIFRWCARVRVCVCVCVCVSYSFHAFDEERNGEALAVLHAIEVIFREMVLCMINPFRCAWMPTHPHPHTPHASHILCVSVCIHVPTGGT